eukprot:107556_1
MTTSDDVTFVSRSSPISLISHVIPRSFSSTTPRSFSRTNGRYESIRQRKLLAISIGKSICNSKNNTKAIIKDYKAPLSFIWYHGQTKYEWINLHTHTEWTESPKQPFIPNNDYIPPSFTVGEVVSVRSDLEQYNNAGFDPWFIAIVINYCEISRRYLLDYCDTIRHDVMEWRWCRDQDTTTYEGKVNKNIQDRIEDYRLKRITPCTPPPFDPAVYGMDPTFVISHDITSTSTGSDYVDASEDSDIVNVREITPSRNRKRKRKTKHTTKHRKKRKVHVNSIIFPYKVKKTDHVQTPQHIVMIAIDKLHRLYNVDIGNSFRLYDVAPYKCPIDLLDCKLWHSSFIICNPPYSNPQPYIKQCIEFSGGGRIAVMILPYGGNKIYWEKYVFPNVAVSIVIRFAFIGFPTPPRFPVCLVFFAGGAKKDAEELSPHGYINVERWKAQTSRDSLIRLQRIANEQVIRLDTYLEECDPTRYSELMKRRERYFRDNMQGV